MRNNLLLLIACCILAACNKNAKQAETNTAEKTPKTLLSTIAFGSCSHQNDSIQMWPEITNQSAELMILTGDNIYGDTQDMDELRKQYLVQKNRLSYQKLLHAMPVIGVWDDHDYGINDGGKNFAKKDESKQLLLGFLDVPEDNPVWSHKGAYNSYTFNDGKLKVILLDTRYFRDTLIADTESDARFLANEEGDILGDEQWQWLENELTNDTASVNLIISSIQLIPDEQLYEKWANFPNSRKRFFELLSKTKPRGTIIISGDRHMAEFSQMNIEGWDHPLYEVTSSGLTHTWDKENPEVNTHRIDTMVVRKNYGLLKIDWDKEKPDINVKIKGYGDSTYLDHTFTF